jgi:hypothetical protein
VIECPNESKGDIRGRSGNVALTPMSDVGWCDSDVRYVPIRIVEKYKGARVTLARLKLVAVLRRVVDRLHTLVVDLDMEDFRQARPSR